MEVVAPVAEDASFQPARGGVVSRQKLEARLRSFEDGHWIELLSESNACAEKAHTQSVRRRRHQHHDDDAKRATRALSLVQVGELSAARQALEGASMAPGTIATLRELGLGRDDQSCCRGPTCRAIPVGFRGVLLDLCEESAVRLA